MPTINDLSATALPIELYFDDTYLGHATAFVWRRHNLDFLITTWHNVSGRSPIDDQPLHSKAAIPNNFRLFAFSQESLSNRFIKTFDLYENGQAMWYVHPEHGKAVDVVAFALAPTEEFRLFPLNEFSLCDTALEVSQDAFILGYPFPPTAGHFWTPIWKRGSVASEPNIDWDGMPLLYLDSATGPGMSGAPVVTRDRIAPAGNDLNISAQPMTRFVGVYAGRQAGHERLEVQLGRVWKDQVIEEIIDGRRRDKLMA